MILLRVRASVPPLPLLSKGRGQCPHHAPPFRHPRTLACIVNDQRFNALVDVSVDSDQLANLT